MQKFVMIASLLGLAACSISEDDFADEMCAAMAACMDGIDCDAEPEEGAEASTCDFDAKAAQACLDGLGECEGEDPFMMPAGIGSADCANVCGSTEDTDDTDTEDTDTEDTDAAE
jgi:hypothetical protein